jgi:hypothetical protein
MVLKVILRHGLNSALIADKTAYYLVTTVGQGKEEPFTRFSRVGYVACFI